MIDPIYVAIIVLLGVLAIYWSWLALRLKPWAWTLVRDTGVHRYYQHPDGRRRVVRVGLGHQPIARAWLDGGDWSLPRGPSWLVGYYRREASTQARPRYSLRFDGELLEADSFAGIIRQMRERGYPEDDIIAAALASLHTPRGVELQRGQR